jgi:hypothetical protein
MEILQSDKVSILKISDYNTKGLTGGDNEQEGGWYKLVRAMGVNSKTGDGGGSFGIGKGAMFAASSLRTVFYSTFISDTKTFAFQGNARLSSFKDEKDDIRRGIGQFGEEKEGQKGIASIRNRDDIPEKFRREEQGTDIFIIGYKPANEDWSKSLLESVLDNFWMAIYDKILKVDIVDGVKTLYEINDGALQELINSPSNKSEETKMFYKAVCQPTKKFEKETALLGRIEFYALIGDGPRQIQCMRRPLMKIYMWKRRPISADFAGVFIARGEPGNTYLRHLEPPAHDKWDKARGDADSKKAFKEIDDWIYECLKELGQENDRHPEEIRGLSRYLPAEADIETDNLENQPNDLGEQSKENENIETIEQRTNLTDNAKTENVIVKRRLSIVKPASESKNTAQKYPSQSGKNSANKSKGVSYNPAGNTRLLNLTDMKTMIRETWRNNERVYLLKILSQTDENGAIRITARGEDDKNYPVNIVNAVDKNGKEYEIGNSEIKGLELKSGIETEIIIKLSSRRRYRLETA